MAPRLPLVPFLAVATMFCVAAVCQDKYYPSCYTAGKYTDGSQYQHNLDQLLRSLPTAASKYWFYNGMVGFAPDQVFGLIMCYADVSAKQCQDCLTGAPAGIREVCPYGRTVIATYDACLLRYSNENFFSVADLTVSVSRWFNSYVDDMASMGDARWKLMSQLAVDAAVSPLRIAINTLQYTDSRGNSQVIDGLAQCTRDLNTAECSRCLNDFVRILSDSRPNNTYGTVKGYSCYVAYKIDGDINITLPPDGEPPPPSPRKKEGARPAPSRRKKVRKLLLVPGVPVGSVVIVGLISLLVWFLVNRKESDQDTTTELDYGNT